MNPAALILLSFIGACLPVGRSHLPTAGRLLYGISLFNALTQKLFDVSLSFLDKDNKEASNIISSPSPIHKIVLKCGPRKKLR